MCGRCTPAHCESVNSLEPEMYEQSHTEQLLNSLTDCRRAELKQSRSPAAANAGVLFLVEGLNDIEFMRRISRILHVNNADLPDLADLENSGCLIFVPYGGG